MSFSNSLQAHAAPQHFERIAKSLLNRRKLGDFSNCDLKINLKNGYDMVHSMVVCAHSTTLSQALENQRAPYQPIDMRDFEPSSVKRVIDWMYSGDISIPEASIAQDLAVASHLRVNLLQRQFEQSIRSLPGTPIAALNIAAARSFSVKPQNAFRPYLTVFHVMDDTMNSLVTELANAVPLLKVGDVAQLTQNSIFAAMAAVLPMSQKVPLINLAIQWILIKQLDKETVNAILQSIVISDITFDTLYAIRYSLRQYLTNPEIAGKSELTISPCGTIGLKIDTKKTHRHRSKSPGYSNCPKQVHRTRSEISALEKLPDPFEPRSRSASQTSLRRDTTDGFPKYFTRSEVENLRAMTDPFEKSEKEEQPRTPVPKRVYGFNQYQNNMAKYPGWSDSIIERNKSAARAKELENAGRYSEADVHFRQQLPDPFIQSPVILMPANGGKVSSRSSNTSFSGRSNKGRCFGNKCQKSQKSVSKKSKRTPNFVITASTNSSQLSERSLSGNNTMKGLKKTASEIAEINALPSIVSHSNSKSTKSLKSSKSDNKKNKTFDRSVYLYPN